MKIINVPMNEIIDSYGHKYYEAETTKSPRTKILSDNNILQIFIFFIQIECISSMSKYENKQRM